MPSKKNQSKAKAKGKKNLSASKTTVAAPSEPTVVEEVVHAVQPEPVVEQTTTPSSTGGGKAKKVKKAKTSKAKTTQQATQQVTPATTVHETSAVETAALTTEATETTVQQTGSGKRVRSFKVRLPGTESYEGRFTGLTPYQAANKALSKYYREVKSPKKEITFSIRESTRGSKRGTYTYNGRREKLEIPVEYSIDDGRTITKNFKNRLTKIKKAELANLSL